MWLHIGTVAGRGKCAWEPRRLPIVLPVTSEDRAAVATVTDGEPPVWQRAIRRLHRAGSGVASGVRGITPWQWLLIAAIVGYVWFFTAQSLKVHHGLGTSAYDFGIFDQGTWLLSRFENPFVTLNGRYLFGDHTSFILIFVAPVYWVFPAAGVLFFLQSAALAAGAIPIYLYARQRLGSDWMAAGLGIAYLMHPVVGLTNLENYHPDSFLGVFVGFAIYFALNERWRPYVVFAVLALLVKEDVAFVLIPLGAWIAWRKDRFVGLVTMAFSAAFMAFAVFVVIGGLTGGHPQAWRIPFDGPIGLLKQSFRNPGEVFDYLTGDGRLWYLWQVSVPFAGVFLLAPEIAAIGSLVVMSNLISTAPYQHMIGFHYTIVALPAIALGTIYALGKLEGRARKAAIGAVLVLSAWTGFLWGTLPWSRDPRGFWPPDHEVAVAARELISLVPDDVSVVAHHTITAHLTHRRQIYLWPTPFRTTLYGGPDLLTLENQRLPVADEVEYVFLQRALGPEQATWEREEARFEIVASNDHWVLYKRRCCPSP